MATVRLAEWDELPELARIGAAAFGQDEIYLHFNPWRSVYPQDWHDSFLHTLQGRFAEAGSVVLVIEVRHKEGEKPVKAGYITATRRGADNRPLSSWMQQRSTWGLQIATPAQRKEAEASRLVTNRSSNPDAIAYYYAEASRIMGGSLANTMEVQTIAVVPGFQRAGIGKVALKWCFDMAEAENVPVVGDASKKGINLYLQTGFKIQGTIVMEATVARLNGRDDVVVEMPRLEVPVVTWTPGTPRRVRLVSVL